MFEAMSPGQKQTALCVQNQNCTGLCWSPAGLTVHTAPGSTLPDRHGFQMPTFENRLVRVFSERACECMSVVGECVRRKSKILQHHSPQLGLYWKQARVPVPQVDQPLQRHCGKSGGTRNTEEQPSPGLSVDRPFSLYRQFDFSCSHRSHLHFSSLIKGVKGRDATSNWPISISQYSAGCLKTGPSEGPSGTREARQFII